MKSRTGRPKIFDEVVGLGLDPPDEGETGDPTGDVDRLREIVRNKEARDGEYVVRGEVTAMEWAEIMRPIITRLIPPRESLPSSPHEDMIRSLQFTQIRKSPIYAHDSKVRQESQAAYFRRMISTA